MHVGIGIGRGHGKGRPRASGPAILFADDFAGDLAAWDTGGDAPDGGCSIVGGKLRVDSGTTSDSNAQGLAAFAASTTGILSARFIWDLVTWTIDSLQEVLLSLAYGMVTLLYDGTDYRVSLAALDGSYMTNVSDPLPIADGAVVQLLYSIAGPHPTLAVYLDGVLATTLTDTTTPDSQNQQPLEQLGVFAFSDGAGGQVVFTLDNLSIADGAQGV